MRIEPHAHPLKLRALQLQSLHENTETIWGTSAAPVCLVCMVGMP